MKLYLIIATLVVTILGTLSNFAQAQTGPLIEIKKRLEPIADVFGQPGLLGYSIDPQAALIDRVVAIVRIFLGLLGIIFVVLIIYGGYLWMTAAGNEQKVEEAQNVLKRAIIGVLIIICAWVIATFVLTNILEVTF